LNYNIFFEIIPINYNYTNRRGAEHVMSVGGNDQPEYNAKSLIESYGT